MPAGSGSHGVVVIDKPAGISSAQALRPVKRLLGRGTKVGHAGTLDPFATGVLLALIGDATRLSDLTMALPKIYRARVLFGRRTDTLDPEGQVVEVSDPGPAPPAGLEKAFPHGEIEQVPPAFSALKVDGKRAYKLARAGETPALKARKVVVHSVWVTDVDWPELEVSIRSGAGFYVRSFARDLGEAVGLPASLCALRRVAVGPFAADDGCLPDYFEPESILPIARLLEAARVPMVVAEPAAARAFAAGRVLRVPCDKVAAVRTPAGLVVGLGHPAPGGLFPRIVFASARRELERL